MNVPGKTVKKQNAFKSLASLIVLTLLPTLAHAMTVAQADEEVAHAERNYSTALGSYKNNAYVEGSGVSSDAINTAAANRAQAYADLRSAQENQASEQAKLEAEAPHINPTSYRLAINQLEEKQEETINVAVTSLQPSTRVKTTVNGITTETTAAEISKSNPLAQVSVPFVSALVTPRTHSDHTDKSGSTLHGGSGRGGDNAHRHAFGGHGYGTDNSKSQGFGGHSHFH